VRKFRLPLKSNYLGFGICLIFCGAAFCLRPSHCAADDANTSSQSSSKIQQKTLQNNQQKGIAPASTKRPYVVAIDPGHGGIDNGASIRIGARTVTEKELTLLVAKDLAEELRKRGFETVFTRDHDNDVSLADRTALANRAKASIFISIHLNALEPKNKNLVPNGIETYILNSTNDNSSKRLADLENNVLKDSKVKSASSTSNIELIVKDVILEANLKPSKELACAVQAHLKKVARDRGIRQALFYVLLGADMPSILIETGFIAHPDDRDRITNPKRRRALAVAIAQAVDDFRHRRKNPAIARQLNQCRVKD